MGMIFAIFKVLDIVLSPMRSNLGFQKQKFTLFQVLKVPGRELSNQVVCFNDLFGFV